MSQVAAQPSPPPVAGLGAVPRILVVDDEQHMCDVCTRILQRAGYDVVATSDPKAAVWTLRSDQRFDLLLTDIKMPEMSGLDLAHIARERDPAIAIIIMTGFASMENLHQSVQRGVADFIFKPFELEHLRLAVDQALQKRSMLQDNLRLHALEQLFESSRALSSTLELSELAAILLRVTTKESNCRAGFLLLVEEPDGLTMTIPSDSGGYLLDAGRRLGQRAFEEQQTLVDSDSPFCRFNGMEFHQALAVPLRAQGGVNGVLLLCDDGPGALRPGVQEEVTLLANHAGAALRNAYLYRQLGEAYQRLQELDRLKSEFISIASHELRTPLAIVLGYTMMVRDQSDGEQREYLQRVMDNAQRIKDIVDDMVSLRHLETGEAQLALEPVVMQELIAQVIERMRPAMLNRPQEFHFDLPEQPLAFLTDREKVLLILGHLLSNAIKFTPEGGQITLRMALRPAGPLESASRIILPSRPAPATIPWVVVEIQDTGIGIPEREQPRIFDRFYQVADSLTRDHGGTGLGLTLVRELAGALGGAVWLTSREGEGSAFAFALPYRQDSTSGDAHGSL
jgi:signal transduction histidine kinase/CheY-like chemotaxis protein